MEKSGNWKSSKLPGVILWSVVILIFVLVVSATNYEFHDPDSQLYSELAQRLSEIPVSSWVAPRWISYSGVDTYFKEHPSGILWVSAGLIKIGAPGGQAAAIANFLYLLITFYFVFKFGAYLENSISGWGMVWAVFLIPVSFLYIVRGNLEPPLTMALIIGIYSLVRVKDSYKFALGFSLALIMAVFFKGLQGGLVGLAGLLYWLIVERNFRLFWILSASAISLVAVMGIYEWLYRIQTGEQFWLANFGIQAVNAVETNLLWQKPYNLLWYLARLLYFTLPWSILLFLGIRNASERRFFTRDKHIFWIIACAFSLVLVMSLFDRRADRYIYPAYILIAIIGGWYVSEKFVKLNNWLKADSIKIQITFAGAVLLLAIAKILFSPYLYTNIQIWRN